MKKTPPLSAAALSLAVLLGSASSARAWNQPTHAIITDDAVQDAVNKGDRGLLRKVPAEPLAELLASPGFEEYKTVTNFAARLELNKYYAFDFQLPEEKGPQPQVEVSKIFEKYVLEPDWTMDQEVCAQYGDCDEVYTKHMMALDKTPLYTQAFRHMYWQNYQELGFGDHLLKTIHTPIGEAPNRCQLFFDLSVKAAKAGHPYWAARFLAWSMHYAQDVTQPFHAAQVPSPNLMVFTRISGDYLPSASETGRVVGYYHLAFEKYMDSYVPALQGAIMGSPIMSNAATAADVTLTGALDSSKFAEAAGNASLRFFPRINHKIEYEYQEAPVVNTDPASDLKEIADHCMVEAGSASKTLLALFKSELAAASSRDGVAQGRSPAPAAAAPDTSKDITRAAGRMEAVLAGGTPSE